MSFNNLIPKHSKDNLVKKHYSLLKVGYSGIGEKALTVIGNTEMNGELIVNGLSIPGGGTATLTALTFLDGNQSNGRVLTVDDSGVVSSKSKLWTTIDNPELVAGPSDNNISTTHNVGINEAAPDELLVVGDSTISDGARLGDITLYKETSTVSTITHSSLKGEATSYGMQLSSTGLTQLNAKTDIEFSNNDVTNMVLTNTGDVGIGITPTVKLHVNGDSIIEGDLTVNGSVVSISSSTMEVTDPNLHLAEGNTGNTIDIGFFGQYSSTIYTGLLRDASTGDNRYILFDNGDTKPGNTLTGTYDLGVLELEKIVVNSSITGTSLLDIQHVGMNFNTGNNIILTDGSIGLNTSGADPLARLDVVGTARITGNLGINNLPATDVSLFINGTDALCIPAGTVAQRPSVDLATGCIRYNTTNSNFEGYNGVAWINMSTGSIFDSDIDTYINAEETPDDDHLRFYTGGVQSMTISATGNIGINKPIPVVALDINKTDAIALPSGTTLQRPTPVAGYIRYNSDKGIIEGYDTTWKSIIGLEDADQDTYITVEEGADNDNIKFYTAGSARMAIGATGKVGISELNPTVTFEIGSTDALKMPSGTTAQRPTPVAGYLRYNSTTAAIEAYTDSWEILSGVRDTDNDTYITAEETADEDYLRFYVAGVEKLTIDNTGKVGINNLSPSTALDVVGTATVDDLVVDNTAIIHGNLTINGTLTTINTTNITIEDPLIKLANANVSDTLDIGIYGLYNDGIDKYSGLFRDSSDGIYKLFTELETEPTTTVATGDISYETARLEVKSINTDIIKALTTLNIVNSSDTVNIVLTSGGLFGIGAGTPTYPLHVTQSSVSSWSARFQNGTSDILIGNDSVNGLSVNSGASGTNTSYSLKARSTGVDNILYVENDGKIGVLTSSPGNVLDISTVVAGEGIKSGVGFVGNVSSTVTMYSHNSFAGTVASAAISQDANGQTAINSASGQSLLIQQNGSTIASFNTSQNLIIGSPTATTSRLSVDGTGLFDDDLQVGTDTLFVDVSTSRVGAGTVNPQSVMHVSGTEGLIVTDAGAVDTTELLGFYQGTGVITQDHYYVKGYFSGVTYPHNITFGSLATAVDTDILTMTLAGNVGIANLNPQAKLDVTGNAIVSGDLTVDTNTLYVNSANNRVGVKTLTPAYPLDVNGDANITGNLIVGSLQLSGSITEAIIIEDPLIKLGDGNTADIVDLGFFGEYNNGVNQVFTGLFRDASDGIYRLFEELQVEPTATVNVAGTGYVLADLEVDLMTCTEIITTSDFRAKENLEKINLTAAEKLLDLDIYKYNLKNSDEENIGIIAQDLEKILPQCVKTINKRVDNELITDFKTIKHNALLISLLSTIQHLNTRIKKLENKN